MLRKRYTTRLGMERLEGRLALAGDVTAVVVDGTLFITGDSDANFVSGGVGNGNASLSGLEGTTINGLNEVSFNSLDIDNVVVKLGGGDDVVYIPNSLITDGDVGIDGGSGKDTVYLSVFGQVAIGGNLIVKNAEQVRAQQAEMFDIGGDLEITTHGGSAGGFV